MGNKSILLLFRYKETILNQIKVVFLENRNSKIHDGFYFFLERRPPPSTVEIPIHRINQSSSSDNPSLTIYEQRRAPRDLCILCDQPLDDVKLTRLCPACDRQSHNPGAYSTSSRPQSTRPGLTNIYVPSSDRSYSTLSPALKTRLSNKIICPHCKMPNLALNLSLNTEFHCSACQNPIPHNYYY